MPAVRNKTGNDVIAGLFGMRGRPEREHLAQVVRMSFPACLKLRGEGGRAVRLRQFGRIPGCRAD